MLGQLINLQRRTQRDIQQFQKDMKENTSRLQKTMDEGFQILNRRVSAL